MRSGIGCGVLTLSESPVINLARSVYYSTSLNPSRLHYAAAAKVDTYTRL